MLALQKTIILYNSSKIVINGEGEHKMEKNLMIDHSVDYSCKRLEDIPLLIKDLGDK